MAASALGRTSLLERAMVILGEESSLGLGVTHDSWEYALHGADWTIGDCAGSQQSPVDLNPGLTPEAGWPLSAASGKPSGKLANNGHALQFDATGGKTLAISDGDFNLAQFHFHSPSEHTVAGERFPLELHLVFKSQASGRQSARNKFAVIGILFESPGYPPSSELKAAMASKASKAGSPQRFIQAKGHEAKEEGEDPFLASLIRKHVGTDVQAENASIASLVNWEYLSTDGRYFKYDGSLTTPNCTEAVAWNVLASAKRASDAQIEFFKSAFWGNYREAKPLNGRVVKLVTPDQSLSPKL